MIAKVIIDIISTNLNKTFDYFIHDQMSDVLQKGMRIIVPFNNQKRLAYVVDIINQSNEATKYVEEILDLTPTITDEQFKLVEQLMMIPQNTYPQCFDLIVSSFLHVDYKKIITLINDVNLDNRLIHKFNKKGIWYPNKSEISKLSSIILKEAKKGLISIETQIVKKDNTKKDTYINFVSSGVCKTDKQKDLLLYVKNKQKVLLSDTLEKYSVSVINSLLKKGYITKTKEEITLKDDESNELNPSINEYTQNYIKDSIIHTNQKEYVSNIVSILKNDHKQVLIIVPEISLVEDLYSDLKKYINDSIYRTYSTLSKSLNILAYNNAKISDSAIIIGTKNAVFLPFESLDKIILIEPFDDKYQNQVRPFFDVEEIIRFRANHHKAVLIKMAYYINSKDLKESIDKKHEIIERKNKYTTDIKVIDMKDELINQNTSMLSRSLKNQIESNLSNNKLTCILMNQLGYAKYVMCKNCSYVALDDETQTPLVYYDTDKTLRSKYSKTKIPFFKTCPACSHDTMQPVRLGLDNLYFTLKNDYKNSNIIKIDKQTFNTKSSIQNLQDKILNTENLILIGTQYMMKFIKNLPIKTYGFLLIDQLIQLPSYNAYENAYTRLLESLELFPNELIIQSYNPNSVVLKYLLKKDETGFTNYILESRKVSNMPPYINIATILFEGKSYLETFKKAYSFKDMLEKLDIITLGIIPSYILMDNDNYRFILTIKYHKLSKEVINLINDSTLENVKITYYPNDVLM